MIIQALPLVFLLVLVYIVARLVFTRETPKSRPSQESHGNLRQ